MVDTLTLLRQRYVPAQRIERVGLEPMSSFMLVSQIPAARGSRPRGHGPRVLIPTLRVPQGCEACHSIAAEAR